MIIKINGLKWTVLFASRGDNILKLDDLQCMGVTDYFNLKIYLDGSISEELMRQTVIHELTHAFLFSYGVHVECDEDTEEAVCDFCGANFDKMLRATNKIIKGWHRVQENFN